MAQTLIPQSDVLLEATEQSTTYQNAHKGFYLNFEKEKITGYLDKLQEVRQAIYLMLSTGRYQHLIFSFDYGHELDALTGKPIPYAKVELPRLIRECLIQDDRIEEVKDFEMTEIEDGLKVLFTVVTIFGETSIEKSIIL